MQLQHDSSICDDEGQRNELVEVPQTETGQVSMEHDMSEGEIELLAR